MSSADHAPARYSVTSLERGLSILRTMQASDGPIRNREIVERTGLPKSTVSRLLGTLSARGYVRRIDTQGSYVVSHSSVRPGRAMLDALGLESHYARLRDLFGEAWVAWMYVQVGDRTARVFRWASDGSGVLATDSGADAVPQSVVHCFAHLSQASGLPAPCWHEWKDALRVLTASAPIDLDILGCYALSVELQLPARPSDAEIESIRRRLLVAADAIAVKTRA